MNRDQWEAVCRKCGRCCYEKVDLGGGIIHYTDEPCVHLDTETNLCKVYEQTRRGRAGLHNPHRASGAPTPLAAGRMRIRRTRQAQGYSGHGPGDCSNQETKP